MERIERRVASKDVGDEIRKIEREGVYDWLSLRAEGDDQVVIVLALKSEPPLEIRG